MSYMSNLDISHANEEADVAFLEEQICEHVAKFENNTPVLRAMYEVAKLLDEYIDDRKDIQAFRRAAGIFLQGAEFNDDQKDQSAPYDLDNEDDDLDEIEIDTDL